MFTHTILGGMSCIIKLYYFINYNIYNLERDFNKKIITR